MKQIGWPKRAACARQASGNKNIKSNCSRKMRYADLVIQACFFVCDILIKPTQPKQLFSYKTEPKKLKPLFSQLKPTETETAN